MSGNRNAMVFDYPLVADEEWMTVNDNSYGYNDQISSNNYQSYGRNAPRSQRYIATVDPSSISLKQRSAATQTLTYERSVRRRLDNAESSYPSPAGSYEEESSPRDLRVSFSARDSLRDDMARSQSIEINEVPSIKSRRFYCDVINCVDQYGKPNSVGRKADLKRHLTSVHGMPTIDCTYKKCPRKGPEGFSREDHFREHLKGYHNEQLPSRSSGRRETRA